MLKRLIATAAFAAGLTFANTAGAQQVTASNPRSVVAAMLDAGYKADLKTDDDGDPRIESTSEGSVFVVFFYGCSNGSNCKTVQIFAGYTDPKNASFSAINKWNKDHRYGRAYISDSGSARVEMDIDLDAGGMSRALFQDNLRLWIKVMSAYEDYVYQKPGS